MLLVALSSELRIEGFENFQDSGEELGGGRRRRGRRKKWAILTVEYSSYLVIVNSPSFFASHHALLKKFLVQSTIKSFQEYFGKVNFVDRPR
jgi:hypothetical protein